MSKWKTISKMTVEIQVAPRAKMWRMVTAAQTSEPFGTEDLDEKECKIGAGRTYQGTVKFRRIPNIITNWT